MRRAVSPPVRTRSAARCRGDSARDLLRCPADHFDAAESLHLFVGGAGADADQQRDVARRGPGQRGRAEPAAERGREAGRSDQRRVRRRGGDDRVEVLVGLGVEHSDGRRRLRDAVHVQDAVAHGPALDRQRGRDDQLAGERLELGLHVPAQQRVDLLERDPAVERPDPARRLLRRQLARVQVDDVAVGVAERDPPRAQHRGHFHRAGEIVGDDEH